MPVPRTARSRVSPVGHGFKAVEKGRLFKGTGFSPYVTTVESTRLQPLRAAISL